MDVDNSRLSVAIKQKGVHVKCSDPSERILSGDRRDYGDEEHKLAETALNLPVNPSRSCLGADVCSNPSVKSQML